MEQQRVAKRQAVGDAIQQQRQIARLDLAFLHKILPVIAGVVRKASQLLRLLSVALDHLDARNRFGQTRVQFAK